MSNVENFKDFVCIDYPGYVKNDEKAFNTLGGLDRIEQTFQRRNGKLLLNFNPENIFSKTLCSSLIETTSSTSSGTSAGEGLDETIDVSGGEKNSTGEFEVKSNSISTSANKNSDFRSSIPCLIMSVIKRGDQLDAKMIGVVKKVYEFEKIADFQYLPMTSHSSQSGKNDEASTTFTAFYDQFRFDSINNYEQDLKRNLLPHYFLLPPFFSRFDDPVNYSFRSESLSGTTPKESRSKSNETKKIDAANQSDGASTSKDTREATTRSASATPTDENDKSNEASSQQDLIRSVRSERASLAYLLTFNSTEPVPVKPNDRLKPARSELVLKCISDLKELFEKRPCYLKSVLLCITNYSQTILKESLPYVAYYFTTGPWRSCWIRYGYDPRLNPESKIYQMIDYRLRYNSEPDQIVKAKPRSSYHKRKFRNDLSESDSEDYKNVQVDKEMYKFRADRLPSSRNVFYQLCDIDDDDIKKLISMNAHTPNSKCSEKDGWCIPQIQDKCREIISMKHEKLSKQMASDNKKKN